MDSGVIVQARLIGVAIPQASEAAHHNDDTPRQRESNTTIIEWVGTGRRRYTTVSRTVHHQIVAITLGSSGYDARFVNALVCASKRQSNLAISWPRPKLQKATSSRLHEQLA